MSCSPAVATGSIGVLLPRARDGDPVAWEEVVRRYGKLVAATVKSFRMQDADALDAVQMTWLRLAENAHRVLRSERLGGWLATTARRECLRILRQAKPIPEPIETVVETAADPSVSAEQGFIDADIARMLWKLVDELPLRQRVLVRALFSDGQQPYAEVARSAGIPAGAIEPTRARALRQLRVWLTSMGYDHPAWQ